MEVPIKQVIVHEGYDSRKNDIALIEMNTTVTFIKKFIRPACLQFEEFRHSKVAAVSGSISIKEFSFHEIPKQRQVGDF